MSPKLHPNRAGFTLVEIMIVVAIIALLAAIAVPNFLRARKRSQATRILEDLRMIDSAIDQYAIETNKTSDAIVYWNDVQRYLKVGSVLYSSDARDILGHSFGASDHLGVKYDGDAFFYVDGLPLVDQRTFDALSDVAPSEFWSPFK